MVENNNLREEEKSVRLYGKVAVMPKNSKASNSYSYLEKIKISKQKLWYILVENQNGDNDEIKMIKYNNKKGVNLKIFVDDLKSYYSNNENMKEYIDKLEIEGNDKFSIIRNIENVDINGKKLLTIILGDLITLLK